MTEMNLQEIEESSLYVSDILTKEYGWNHLAFVDGMAPIDFRNGKQVWKPKAKLLKIIFGRSNGQIVEIGSVVKPGTYLKFILPNQSTQKTMDYQNWRGYFDREAVYSEEGAGFVLDRWVRFENFNNRGFQFTVEYIDKMVEVFIPSIVFFGAEWIKVSNPANNNA